MENKVFHGLRFFESRRGDVEMNVKKSYFKYFTALLMFGMNGIVASYISLSSYEIVLTRTMIGSLLLIIVFTLTRQRLKLFENKKDMLYILISGVSMGTSWLFLYEAYQQIGVSIASLLYYCGPVIVMILSPILFNEKLTWPKIIGFLSVMIGMFFVNIQALNEGKTIWGILFGIMSAVLYAVMVIFNKKSKTMKGLENSTWQLLISFLTVALFVGIKQGYAIKIETDSILPILILGIFNTGIGCYFYFSSIGSLPVQTVAICGYLEPLSAVVLSMLFLKERMTTIQLVGAVLIIGGAAFGELIHKSPIRGLQGEI